MRTPYRTWGCTPHLFCTEKAPIKGLWFMAFPVVRFFRIGNYELLWLFWSLYLVLSCEQLSWCSRWDQGLERCQEFGSSFMVRYKQVTQTALPNCFDLLLSKQQQCWLLSGSPASSAEPVWIEQGHRVYFIPITTSSDVKVSAPEFSYELW